MGLTLSSSNHFIVSLLYWDQAPNQSNSIYPRIFRSGHIALEVKKNGLTHAYLGWWPKFYSVQRINRPRSFFRKLPERLALWFLRVDGRLSSYGVVEDAMMVLSRGLIGQIKPDDIDSILVGNKARGVTAEQWSTPENWKIAEIPPSTSFTLPGVDAIKILQYIQEFRAEVEANCASYQFIFNNCATVVAKALRCGGFEFSSCNLWWPSRLKRFLLNHKTS